MDPMVRCPGAQAARLALVTHFQTPALQEASSATIC